MNGRTSWREERKLNTETFGVGSTNYYNRNRGFRGRGGGFRGRGGMGYGGRGRGGYWGMQSYHFFIISEIVPF